MNTISGLQTTYVANQYTSDKGVDAQTSADQAGNAKTNDPKSSGDKIKDLKVQQEVLNLQQRENKVKSHEAAHMTAGGRYAGAAHYQRTVGLDGKSYISGGEVSIDISTDKDPKKTIAKMQQVIRAAMAPADPSPQDYSVAAKASSILAKAAAQVAQESKGQAIDIAI